MHKFNNVLYLEPFRDFFNYLEQIQQFHSSNGIAALYLEPFQDFFSLLLLRDKFAFVFFVLPFFFMTGEKEPGKLLHGLLNSFIILQLFQCRLNHLNISKHSKKFRLSMLIVQSMLKRTLSKSILQQQYQARAFSLCRVFYDL